MHYPVPELIEIVGTGAFNFKNKKFSEANMVFSRIFNRDSVLNFPSPATGFSFDPTSLPQLLQLGEEIKLLGRGFAKNLPRFFVALNVAFSHGIRGKGFTIHLLQEIPKKKLIIRWDKSITTWNRHCYSQIHNRSFFFFTKTKTFV